MNDIKTIVRRPKAPKQITSASPSPTAFSLNTTNPEALELAHANIRITVLGGVAISGLERFNIRDSAPVLIFFYL